MKKDSVRFPPKPPKGRKRPPEAIYPQIARDLVFERDKGECVDCGLVHGLLGEWDVDHNIPLWKVPREGTFDEKIWYWSLANLATRCVEPCHRIKTAKEAAERAHHRALEKKRAGQPRRQRLSRKMNGKTIDTRRKVPF